MFIVFRASGADFNPQEFVAAHKLDGCSFWLRGVPNRATKRAPETSGFRLSLPDAADSSEAGLLIEAFIKNGEHWLDALKESGGQCEMDIGLAVGSESAFTASVSFDPSLLSKLASHQIELVCSAYPSGD